jgi:hypothetical protein
VELLIEKSWEVQSDEGIRNQGVKGFGKQTTGG